MTQDRPILTLEPLIDAVQSGVEAAGWTLSGLQKTTSHQFEGRWEGEATRSAYLFFHRDSVEEEGSIDVFLDETTRGLTGNLALVLELVPLAVMPDVEGVLARLAALAGERLPTEYRTPTSLRFSLPDRGVNAGAAESQLRLKVRIPRRTIHEGEEAVTGLARACVAAFSEILVSDELEELMRPAR